MKYLLLLFGDESSWADMTEEEAGAELAAYERYGEEATKAGVFVAGEGLQPTSTATTVRIARRRAPPHRRAFRRDEGAARRLLRSRLQGPRRCSRLGGAMPRLRERFVEIRPVMDYEAVGYGESGGSGDVSR